MQEEESLAYLRGEDAWEAHERDAECAASREQEAAMEEEIPSRLQEGTKSLSVAGAGIEADEVSVSRWCNVEMDDAQIGIGGKTKKM